MIDAHAHLDFDALRGDLAGVLERAATSRLDAIVCAGYSPDDFRRQVEVCTSSRELGFRGVFMAAGLHPWAVAEVDAEEALDASLALLEAAIDDLLATPAQANFLCGLGECGLDYYRVDRQDALACHLQERAFIRQLELADAYHLPAVVHAVRAHQEALTILARHAPSRGVQMHGYSGPVELIGPLAEVWAVFSFGTPLSWKGQKTIKRALRRVVEYDDTLWMLETDAPDRPVARAKDLGVHGQPCHLEEVARAAAEILDWPVEEVEAISHRNAARFFALAGAVDSRSDHEGTC